MDNRINAICAMVCITGIVYTIFRFLDMKNQEVCKLEGKVELNDIMITKEKESDNYIIIRGQIPRKLSENKGFAWDHVPDLMEKGVKNFIWTNNGYFAITNVYDEYPIDLDLIYCPGCTTYIRHEQPSDELREKRLELGAKILGYRMKKVN